MITLVVTLFVATGMLMFFGSIVELVRIVAKVEVTKKQAAWSLPISIVPFLVGVLIHDAYEGKDDPITSPTQAEAKATSTQTPTQDKPETKVARQIPKARNDGLTYDPYDPTLMLTEQDYRNEIVKFSIDPCVLVSVRNNGLDKTMGKEEAIALVKAMTPKPLENMVKDLMPLVTGQDFNARKVLYDWSRENCISGANSVG